MLLLCYMTSFVLESFIFFFILYDHVICGYDRYYASVTPCDLYNHNIALHSSSKSNKIKEKLENK